ncbi:hypothetical protein Tco_1420502 [Tanacetum coccineum]
MEAHLAPKSSVQVNKIAYSCEICSGSYDTQYCMENPEQAFVDYASSHTDEAEGKWFTFKPEQNNLGDTYNSSWKSHLNLRWRQPQNSQNNFSNPLNRFQPNGLIPNLSFNNNPQNLNNQSNLEGLMSNFMASQEARLSKFESDFKQQQGEMTNKIDRVLKAINDRMTGALPSDTVKNPKLNDNSTSPVLSAHSYPTRDPQCSSQIHGHDTIAEECKISKEEGKEENVNPENINTNPPSPPDPSISFITKKVCKLNSFLESINLIPRSSDAKFVCTKDNDGDVMFIEIIKKYDDSSKEELGEYKAYIDLNSPLNVMTRMQYNWIMRKQLEPREDPEGIRGINNFTGRIKGMHIFVGNFTYVSDFMIVEDISLIIDPRLSQVVLGKPFVEISNMTHDLSLGVVKFTDETNEIAYKMPHKIEQYNSLSDLKKEHTKSVYLRNEEDKRRGVDYVMSKILGFYKKRLELGPEYLNGLEDEGGVMLYLMRRSLGVLRRIVHHDLYFGGKALVERENVGLDLTKSSIYSSFIEDQPAKGVDLRVVDSHTGNHREDGFTPLETIRSLCVVFDHPKGKVIVLPLFAMNAKDTICIQICELTKEELANFLEDYPIPLEYKDMLPKHNQTIIDAPDGYLNTFGCAKLTTFAVMCKVYGCEPSVELFHGFFNLFPGGKWLTFAKRPEKHIPNLMPKVITRIEGWKGRFFFVQDSVVLVEYPQLLSKDNMWDTKSFKEKLPPQIEQNPMFERLGRYPANVRIFPDPILFMAGLKPTWEHGQQRPTIIIGGKDTYHPNFLFYLFFSMTYDLSFLFAKMAFRNFMYAKTDEDLSFLPKEPSPNFGTGSSSVSINTEPPVVKAEATEH